MLDLHYWPTPNGKKVTIQLEECGLDYQVIPCNIGKGDQFTDSFLGLIQTIVCRHWLIMRPRMV